MIGALFMLLMLQAVYCLVYFSIISDKTDAMTEDHLIQLLMLQALNFTMFLTIISIK